MLCWLAGDFPCQTGGMRLDRLRRAAPPTSGAGLHLPRRGATRLPQNAPDLRSGAFCGLAGSAGAPLLFWQGEGDAGQQGS
jgi:hypothetical protein